MAYSPALEALFAGLNHYQVEAVNFGSGQLCLIGIPGSGKTRTVVARIGRLVSDGIPADSILAMTFTRAAAMEMTQRLQQLGIRDARVGTIHSVCRQIAASETPLLSYGTVDERERMKLELKKLLGEYRRKGSVPERGADLEGVCRFVEACKADGVCYVDGDPWGLNLTSETHIGETARKWTQLAGVRASVLSTLFMELERRRGSMNLYGFDDMLLWAWMVLASNAEARTRWRQRWSVVIIDECFHGLTPVTMADGHQIAIQDVVAQRLVGPALSYDESTGKNVRRRITGWHKLLVTKPMVRVVVRTRTSTDGQSSLPVHYLVCTEDQGVWTPAGWRTAGSLHVGDVVVVESTTPRHTHSDDPFANKVKHGTAGRLRLGELIRQRNQSGTCGSNRNCGAIVQRGGNGTGMSSVERVVALKLGDGWQWNHPVAPADGTRPFHYKIDFARPDLKLGVEVDGSSHNLKTRKAADRRRDQRLAARGWRVVRITNSEALRITACELLTRLGLPACPVEADVIGVESWLPKDAYVYDIDVEGTHTFYADGIVVHNCQDSSPVQWDIARLLVGLDSCVPSAKLLPTPPTTDDGLHNLMVVGDSSQSIYSWRSARPQNFVEYATAKDVTLLTLPLNYRSNSSICKVATGLVKTKTWHLGGVITSTHEEQVPNAVTIKRYSTVEEEAESIVARCRELAADGRGLRSCAVLSRLRVGLDLVEISCIRQRVPYIKMAAGSFFESREVRDVLAYLRVASSLDPDGRWSKHIVNKPFRFIGAAFITKAEIWAQANGTSFFDALSQLSEELNYRQRYAIRELCRLLQDLAKVAAGAEMRYQAAERELAARQAAGETGLPTGPNALIMAKAQTLAAEREAAMTAMLESGDDQPMPVQTVPEEHPEGPADMLGMVLRRTNYIEELRREEGLLGMDESRIAALAALQRMAFFFPTAARFLAYVDALTVAVEQARKSGLRLQEGAREDALVLSTIHRCKGLEWRHVFLADAAPGRFPCARSMNPDEELRLLYVAVTRAMETCQVSYAGAIEDGENRPVRSLFIDLLEKEIADLYVGVSKPSECKEIPKEAKVV